MSKVRSKKPSQTNALWSLMARAVVEPRSGFFVGLAAGLLLALVIVVKLG